MDTIDWDSIIAAADAQIQNAESAILSDASSASGSRVPRYESEDHHESYDHGWDEKEQDENEIVDKHSAGSGSPDGQHEHGDIFGFADDDVVESLNAVLESIDVPTVIGSLSNSCLRAINSLIGRLRREQDSARRSAREFLDADAEITRLHKRIAVLEEDADGLRLNFVFPIV